MPKQIGHIMEIVKGFRFEAAHKLTRVPQGHKCGRLHGHSFLVEVKIKGIVNEENSWVMDYADISKIVTPIIHGQLDHYYLNEIEDLGEPTSESIAIWLWNKLKTQLPYLYEVIVHETCTSKCIYQGKIGSIEECLEKISFEAL